jgi:hypothetical protein
MRLLPLASGALVLLACGGRSTLGVGDGSATASGGSGSGSGSGSGASTGVGGGTGGQPPTSCNALQLGFGPTMLPYVDPFFHSARPDLVGLESTTTALVVALVPVESPGPPPFGVAHVSLSPWTGNNLIAAEPQQVSQLGGRSFVATETGRVGLYAMGLNFSFTGPGQSALRVLRTLDPQQSYGPDPPGVEVPVGPARPELVVDTPDGLVFGWEILPSDQNAYLGLARIGEELELATSSESGCAQYGLEVRAAPRGPETLIAMASGRAAYSCFDDDGIPGPPVRLQTGTLDPESLAMAIVEDEVLSEPLQFVELVSDASGSWVVYQTDGSTALQPPPLFAQRVDDAGAFVGPAIDATMSGLFPPYGVTAIGGGFAVAYLDVFDPGPPTLVVRVFGDDGALWAETSVTLSSFIQSERLALATSPSDDAILVAFAASGEGQANPTGLVRFDCVSGTSTDR